MTEIAKLVAELNIKDVTDGGACFEIEPSSSTPDPTDELNYLENVQPHILVDTIDHEAPFDVLAQDMTNLLPSGKIKKKIMRAGYGPTATEGKLVEIHYNAYQEFEPQPFDSTYGRKESCKFTVDGHEVLEGLDIAVNSMQLNEKSQFLVDSELAYRNSGLNRVKPNSTVLFVVELLKIQNAIAEETKEEKRSFERVHKQCLALNELGRSKFNLKDYEGALRHYGEALNKIESAMLKDYDEQLKSDKMLLTCYTNLLICHTILENPKRGCDFANKIYDLSANQTVQVPAKVYFNNAKCLKMLGGFSRARECLTRAKRLEPDNKAIDREFISLSNKQMQYKKRITRLSRAFAGN